MKKLKKQVAIIVILMIILTVFGVFRISKISNAYKGEDFYSPDTTEQGLGGHTTINNIGSEFWQLNNLYCVDHGQNVSHGTRYTWQSKVTINGDVATFEVNGRAPKTVTSDKNRLIAAILTPNNYLPDVAKSSARYTEEWWGLGTRETDTTYTMSQLALYKNWDDWVNATGASNYFFSTGLNNRIK